MKCLYCKGRSVKNGLFSINKQRYKCLNCDRYFSDVTIENRNNKKPILLVLHLILAGCSNWSIHYELGIDEKIIKKWRKIYFKVGRRFLPPEPLLPIRKLIAVYEKIEKSCSTKFDRGGIEGRRKWGNLE